MNLTSITVVVCFRFKSFHYKISKSKFTRVPSVTLFLVKMLLLFELLHCFWLKNTCCLSLLTVYKALLAYFVGAGGIG